MLAACSGGEEQQAGAAAAQGPVTVGYVQVRPTDVPMVTTLPGRTAAYETSEVRPQVSGVIQRRLFNQGEWVKRGQTLYQIDPSLYEAAVGEAQANLQSAQAQLESAQALARRYKPLAEMEAVSQQDYTDAVAQARQAEAAVAQSKAALRTAQINLRFSKVPAPISGKIGRTLATVGALVTQNQADPLTVIQRLDPIYVDIQQSSTELLNLRRALAREEGVVPTSARVRLRLEDGSMYDYTGSVELSEAMVDQSTGTVTLRARFPNPEGVLLPGMYVQAMFAQAIDQRAFLVPPAGVSRDAKGDASVLIVGPDNKVVQRKVTAPRMTDNKWVVTSGLKPDDKLIVQGTEKIQPGATVKAVPADSPQQVGTPAAKPQQPNADEAAAGGEGEQRSGGE
ncbi:efflux RND transporter periplasmic adaptor subunit [Stakelama saccharophila]|uniref:Efflux RND transporter periplasmic adaptor subunit n=2 Tax=Stakelama saccharophila TaxID=3075605 RepID=A0ABZ0BCU6_9SPHN|nr:efflux RND transporter periplasmic adaptor subunit [Stakelama sp. W311]WNO55113.1 efflux RND transporter periplasmic adaptor subunit [Stakelama sp. W311]